MTNDAVVIPFGPSSTSGEGEPATAKPRRGRRVPSQSPGAPVRRGRKGAAVRREEAARLAAVDASLRAALDSTEQWVELFRAMVETGEFEGDSLTVADVEFLTGRSDGAAELLEAVWLPHQRRVRDASVEEFEVVRLRPRPSGVIGAGHARRVVTSLLQSTVTGGFAWGPPRVLARLAVLDVVRRIEALHAELVEHRRSGSPVRFASTIPGGDAVVQSVVLDHGGKRAACDAVALLHTEAVAGVHSYLAVA